MKNPLPGLHFGLRVKVELSAILNVSVSYCISLQLLEGAQDKETSYEELKQERKSCQESMSLRPV